MQVSVGRVHLPERAVQPETEGSQGRRKVEGVQTSKPSLPPSSPLSCCLPRPHDETSSCPFPGKRLNPGSCMTSLRMRRTPCLFFFSSPLIVLCSCTWGSCSCACKDFEVLLASRSGSRIPTNAYGAWAIKAELCAAYAGSVEDAVLPHAEVKFLPGPSHSPWMLLYLAPTQREGASPLPHFLREETMAAKGM